MKIVIGYDGSDCADAALKDLLRSGLPGSVEALVVSVAEQWLPPPPPSSYEIVGETFAEGIVGGVLEAERQASEIVERAHQLAFQAGTVVQGLFPTWTVRSETYWGSPASEIIKRAEEWDADLIVVGSHGRSALGRFILGSVSQRVVTDAHCSVRVARHQAREKGAPARIIIGMDGSPGAEIAVKEVAARTWPQGTEVRLVSSVGPFHEVSNEDRLTFIQLKLQAAETTLRATGLRAEPLIRDEDPKQLLVAEAERWNADAIFVGARGLGRIGRFLLGSVSTAVVSRAHCSVEVARGL